MIDFIKNKWLNVLIRFLFIAGPIIACVYFLANYSDFLDYFSDIGHNEYTIQNILIVFIFLSLSIILINLIFYLLDYSKLIWDHRERNTVILIINRSSAILSLIILLLITIYIMAIIFKKIDMYQIVEYNLWLSVLIFSIFLLIDVCLAISNKIELKWIEKNGSPKEPSNSDTDEKKELNTKQQKEEKKINIKLSLESIFLVNIPTLLLLIAAYYLSNHLKTDPYFIGVTVDNNFIHPLYMTKFDEKVYQLFTNGIEAGIIMCCIIFSQFVFIIIKTNCDYLLHLNKRMR